jgi:MFS transporter, putative metabolite:H+ symporter
VGALVAWILRKRMPESPRWLASKGREREALAVVESIEAACGVQPSVQTAVTRETPSETSSRLRDLFAPGMRARTISAITVLVVQFVAQFAFVSWIPTFLVKEGHTISSSLGLTAIMFAGGPVGSIIAFLLTERIGRKWGIVAFSLICAALGVGYPFAQSEFVIAALGFAITACLYVLSSFTIASYVPELFPTALRLRGAGLANTIGRAVSIALPYAVAAAYAGTGIAGVLTLIVGTLLAQALIVGMFGPETKNRSLEDISDGTEEAARARGEDIGVFERSR